MKISDRTKDKIKDAIKDGFYGASFILIAGLIDPDDLKLSFYTAIAFIILRLITPPIITFMSDSNGKNRYT